MNARQSRRQIRSGNGRRIARSRTTAAVAAASLGALAPPPFSASITFGRTLRFRASSALSSQAITASNLLDLLVMATTTTAVNRIISSIRLDRVEVWGPMASDLVPVTVAVEYNTDSATGLASSNKLRSDTSMGADHCAHVRYRPPVGTLASFWQGPASSQRLFLLTCPTNSIVDIQVVMVVQNGETPVAAANAAVAATVGAIYCRGLDGLATAGSVLPPVSYPQI